MRTIQPPYWYALEPEKCEIITSAYRVNTEDAASALSRTEFLDTDTFDYLGVQISVKGIDFKLMC